MTLRVGLIVPSSNVTMETEIPLYLGRHALSKGQQITFHSSRTRMKKVTAHELRNMATDSERCAREIADANVDVVAHALPAEEVAAAREHGILGVLEAQPAHAARWHPVLRRRLRL